MSDRHERDPREGDLDTAFDSLTAELATRPGRPGARAAITAARKRRRTQIGVAAAVVAVTAAGFALPTLLDAGDVTGGGFADGALPQAAPLTAEALTEATQGWVGPWEALDSTNVDRLVGFDGSVLAGSSPEWEAACTYQPGEEMTVEPSRLGDQLYLADGTAVTSAAFLDLETAPVAMEVYGGLHVAMSRCLSGFEETTRGEAVLVHGTSTGAPVEDDSADTEELWVARLGDRVGMISVLRSSSAAPEDSMEAVGELLLAAMQDETSYETSWSAVDESRSGLTGPEETLPRYPDLTPAGLRRITGEWADGWRRDADPSRTALHCVPTSWPSTAAWGSSSSVGDRGELSYATTDDGAADIADLLSALSRCLSTRWTVHPSVGERGTAAWAAYDGGALFAAERDGVVALLQVRDVPTTTSEVADALIALLERNLAQPG